MLCPVDAPCTERLPIGDVAAEHAVRGVTRQSQIKPLFVLLYDARQPVRVGVQNLFDIRRRQVEIRIDCDGVACIIVVRPVGIIIEIGLFGQREAAARQIYRIAAQQDDIVHRAAAFACIKGDSDERIGVEDRDLHINAAFVAPAVRVEENRHRVARGIERGVCIGTKGRRTAVRPAEHVRRRGIAVIYGQIIGVFLRRNIARHAQPHARRRDHGDGAVAAVGVVSVHAAVVKNPEDVPRLPAVQVRRHVHACGQQRVIGVIGVRGARFAVQDDRRIL